MHGEKRFTYDGHWNTAQQVAAARYICGYCTADTGSGTGWVTDRGDAFIRICPNCNGPTFFAVGSGEPQWPGPKPGQPISALDEGVAAIYEEARASIASRAFTGSVMLCRKILMHVAVEKGADEGQSFQAYVRWLIDERYAPRGAEDWLDYVRNRANEANHEIVVMTKEDAVGVLHFTEALLRGVYELPFEVPKLAERSAEAAEETQEPAPEAQ